MFLLTLNSGDENSGTQNNDEERGFTITTDWATRLQHPKFYTEQRRAVEQHSKEPGSAERQQKQLLSTNFCNSFDFQRKATNHD